jgi:hypothetical protein
MSDRFFDGKPKVNNNERDELTREQEVKLLFAK